MKAINFLLFSLLFGFSGVLHAQAPLSPWESLNSNKVEVKAFDRTIESDPEKVFIEMPYGTSTPLRITDPTTPQNGEIESVTLVYTSFSRATLPHQAALNKERLDELLLLYPYLQKSASTVWKSIEITEPKSIAEARSQFHGFVLTFSKVDEEIPLTQERKGMTRISPPTNLDSATIQTFSIANNFFISFSNNNENPEIIPYVLNRNKDWKDMLIVVDVTTSMDPYNLQLLSWLKLNENLNRTEHFTFFNDGDNKKTMHKYPGKVGGIYHAPAVDFEAISATAREARIKGIANDDIPENNLEALVEAIQKGGEFKALILIADNPATPRDMFLLPTIDHPVHVILCGNMNNVNSNYMNIALKTGGSIHTIENDIENLKALNEGEIITVKGQQFKITNGAFVPVIID